MNPYGLLERYHRLSHYGRCVVLIGLGVVPYNIHTTVADNHRRVKMLLARRSKLEREPLNYEYSYLYGWISNADAATKSTRDIRRARLMYPVYVTGATLKGCVQSILFPVWLPLELFCR